jgi:hypothetical protein
MSAPGCGRGTDAEDPQTSRLILETGDDLRGGWQGDSPSLDGWNIYKTLAKTGETVNEYDARNLPFD